MAINLRAAEFLRQKLTFDTERHERRRTLLTEAKVLAARLANATSPAAADLRRFDELYDADLIGVEQLHGEVESQMVEFRKRLRGEPSASDEPFNQLALRLATACENELKASEDALLEQHDCGARDPEHRHVTRGTKGVPRWFGRLAGTQDAAR